MRSFSLCAMLAFHIIILCPIFLIMGAYDGCWKGFQEWADDIAATWKAF